MTVKTFDRIRLILIGGIDLGKNPLIFPEFLKALSVEGRKPVVPIKAGGMAFTLVKRNIYDLIRRKSSEGKFEWFWCEHITDEETGLFILLGFLDTRGD